MHVLFRDAADQTLFNNSRICSANVLHDLEVFHCDLAAFNSHYLKQLKFSFAYQWLDALYRFPLHNLVFLQID
jgi:hypothetical protein